MAPGGCGTLPAQARQLLGQLAKTPVTQRNFAPRRVLSWLLREVLVGGERVEYADLKWRAERFLFLVLVRPDGYLVAAPTGTPLQRLGPLRLVDGVWKVGPLVVGDFYFSRGGVFYPVNEALRRVDVPPLAELGLGRDPLNAALDGAQDALGRWRCRLPSPSFIPSARWRIWRNCPARWRTLSSPRRSTSRAMAPCRGRTRSARRRACPRTCS
ncbi:hypothetical protein ACN28S_04265 [Cystobacter fuscus]